MTAVVDASDAITYWRGFDDPFCTCPAAGVAPSAVSKFDVVIGGVGYMVDTNLLGKDYFASIPLLRSMFLQDRGTIPIGEHSLNPSDYWRRSVDDWSAGAGQKALDHSTANDNQFRISKGVDVWTVGELGLLNEASVTLAASSATLLKIVVAGGVMYLLADDVWSYGDPAAVSVLTPSGGDTAVSGATSIATDGYITWVTDSVRTHYTLRGTTTYLKYHTADHPADLIRSAKYRLFTVQDATIFTHSGNAGSAVATAYFTHPNANWHWSDIVGGPDAIYFAGSTGDQSVIYASTIKSDGTDLDAPVAAATLPSGELAQSLYQYLNVLLIGTNKGVRVAVLGSGGGLTLAGLIPMDSAPQCFEAQDRFVWFGWTNYDTDSTGLGRIDLSTLNANTDLFAYASDLMLGDSTTPAQGQITSVITFGGKRIFATVGHGVVSEGTAKIAQGTIKSGWLNYALAESKLAIKIAVANRAGEGSYAVDIAIDDLPAVPVGDTVATLALAGNAETIPVPQLQGRSFEVGLTLNRSGTDATQSVVLDRWTLMVEPQPERRAQFQVPLLLHNQQLDRLQSTVFYQPAAERRRFFELMESRTLVPFQDREVSYVVIVDDFSWMPYEHVGAHRRQGSWDGTLIVVLKVVN